jgi:hypothetical protein
MKDLAIEKLVSHSTVVRFYKPVLPWTAMRDERCLDIQRIQPAHLEFGNELWPVVTANVLWSAMLSEKIC